MWKCSHCGQKNEDMAESCVRCGDKRVVRESVTGKRSVPIWLYGILAVSLLASGCLFALYFLNPSFARAEQAAAIETTETAAQTERPIAAPDQNPPVTSVPTAIPTEAQTPVTVGELGTFSLTALDGRTVDDSLFSQNKLTMVNFWATWCGPCVGEIPDLQRIADDYASSGFGIVGVLVADEDTEGALDFLQSNGITYPVVMPEGPFAAISNEFDAIPTTIFFDSNGNRVGETQTGAKDYASWASLIDSLLADIG